MRDFARLLKLDWPVVYEKAGREVLFLGVLRALGKDFSEDVDWDIRCELLVRDTR